MGYFGVWALMLGSCLLLVLFVACGAGPSVVNPGDEFEPIDLSFVTTDGNRSYIPINSNSVEPASADYSSFIFGILNEFEDSNPDLQIIYWRTEREDFYTYGIWIDHKPK